MTKQKSDAAKQFTKPAHWTNDPVPAPKQVDPLKGEPKELSPTHCEEPKSKQSSFGPRRKWRGRIMDCHVVSGSSQ
jgi:hypothetical protein